MPGPLGTSNLIWWVVIFGLPGLIFLGGSMGNLMIVWGRLLRNQGGGSMIMFIPGIAGMVAVGFCPIESIRHYGWLALFLDVGCVPYIVYELVVVHMLQRATFVGYQPPRLNIYLSLYRNGLYRVSAGIGTYGPISRGKGTWMFADGKLLLHDGDKAFAYSFQRVADTHGRLSGTLVWVDGQSGYLPQRVDLRQMFGKPLMGE